MKRYFVIILLFTFTSCVTYTELSVNSLKSGMTVQEVRYSFGTPYKILTARNTISGYIEVLEYRRGREVYALEFWDDYLVGYEIIRGSYITPVAPPLYRPAYGTSVLVIRDRHNHNYYRPQYPAANPPSVNHPSVNRPPAGTGNNYRPGIDNNRPVTDDNRQGSVGIQSSPSVETTRPGTTSNARPGVNPQNTRSVETSRESTYINQSTTRPNVVSTPAQSGATRSNNVSTQVQSSSRTQTTTTTTRPNVVSTPAQSGATRSNNVSTQAQSSSRTQTTTTRSSNSRSNSQVKESKNSGRK